MSRILLVDDDANVRQSLGAVLDGAGHTVTVASDGREALRLAVARHPDVIVSDITMPVMDGAAMVQKIKAVPGFERIPVVLMSSKTTVPPVPVARMLRKPFDPATLLVLLDKLTTQLTSHEARNKPALSGRPKDRTRKSERPPVCEVCELDLATIDLLETRIRRGFVLVHEQEERLRTLRAKGADTSLAEALYSALTNGLDSMLGYIRLRLVLSADALLMGRSG
ncbi:response regulator [Paraburkholderia tagetis]|uniref:Response regulator n=1 Tax=Paraburkholderia tagetis TaxID=2913261 RepID=A0A9X1UK79_9BURK|nr:response regulator [Paraburkholderia tagetis]